MRKTVPRDHVVVRPREVPTRILPAPPSAPLAPPTPGEPVPAVDDAPRPSPEPKADTSFDPPKGLRSRGPSPLTQAALMGLATLGAAAPAAAQTVPTSTSLVDGTAPLLPRAGLQRLRLSEALRLTPESQVAFLAQQRHSSVQAPHVSPDVLPVLPNRPQPIGGTSPVVSPDAVYGRAVGLDQVRAGTIDDFVATRAAFGQLLEAGMARVLRSTATTGYRFIDLLPPSVRRPFDQAFGILLDNAVAIPPEVLTTRLPFAAGELPARASLHLPAFPQQQNSCGETASADVQTGMGIPVALDNVDTQLPFVQGTNLDITRSLRDRGLTVISGPGTLEDLKTYVANGYPVMVSVGWQGGGGHYAVVTGYDDATGNLQINGYRFPTGATRQSGGGALDQVSYSEFAADWGRRLNEMLVVHPQRDERLTPLREAGRISRTAEVQEGLSITELWFDRRALWEARTTSARPAAADQSPIDVHLQMGWRARSRNGDLTILRVGFTTAEIANPNNPRTANNNALDPFSWRLDSSQTVGAIRFNLHFSRIAQNGPEDSRDLEAVVRNTALTLGLESGGFSASAGYEREQVQARFQYVLNSQLGSLHADARVAVGPNGDFNVFIGATGTF